MIRSVAAIAFCAFAVAGCSVGSPTGGSTPMTAASSRAPDATGAIGGRPSSTSGTSMGTLDVVAVHHPVCGPQPLATAGSTTTSCAEEPVVGVDIVATRADGSVAGRGTTDSAGRLVLPLAPGS